MTLPTTMLIPFALAPALLSTPFFEYLWTTYRDLKLAFNGPRDCHEGCAIGPAVGRMLPKNSLQERKSIISFSEDA